MKNAYTWKTKNFVYKRNSSWKHLKFSKQRPFLARNSHTPGQGLGGAVIITRVPMSKSSELGSKGEGAPGRGVVSATVRDLAKFVTSGVASVALAGSGVAGGAGEAGETTPAARVRAWIGDVLSAILGASLPESSGFRAARVFESFDSRLESSEESGRFWSPCPVSSLGPSWKRWPPKMLSP